MKDLRPLAKRQGAAGIPENYRYALLSTWKPELANPGVDEVVREYITNLNHSLFIWGPVGSGKTWAACTIANELLRRGKTVRFQAMSRLLLELRASFSSHELSELQFLSPLFGVEFLVLDDLGDVGLNSEPQASHFAATRILLLIEERTETRRPTVMTSNLSLAELVRWVGDERIGSRIRGICGERGIVELTGRDLRFDPEREEVAVR